SRPEIDAKKLGCTGCSGGGTLTSYLMALDERIACAAPSCYVTSLERLFATIGPQDAEQNITGQVAFGMEHADYLTLRAPRPTLMCVATYDFFDIQGAWSTFREASLIYGKLGYGERVALFEFEDKHGFSRPRREAAARWLSRWLLQRDEPIKEGDWPVFKDADLQCTRSGQVLEEFKGKSVFHFNVEEARALASQRVKFTSVSANEQQAAIRGLLGLPDKVKAATLAHAGNIALVAHGITGPIALHAGALEPRIQSVHLEHSVPSWMSVVETPVTYNQLSSVLPGVLKVYDLPDLAATLGRRLQIVTPRNGG